MVLKGIQFCSCGVKEMDVGVFEPVSGGRF